MYVERLSRLRTEVKIIPMDVALQEISDNTQYSENISRSILLNGKAVWTPYAIYRLKEGN